jgi:regulatory protein
MTQEDDTEASPEKAAETRLAVENGAIRLLARREHSRTELRNKLLLRSYPSSIIEEVLDQLAEQGLQSDERFAESYTRARSQRGYGGNKIRAELMSRDVDRDTISVAIESLDDCWVEYAAAMLAKKYPDYSKNNASSLEHAKMQRYLWSRGYNSDQVKLAIRRLHEN